MALNDEQKQAVTQWVAAGCGLNEIQQRLESELGVRMTFMDVRFLLIDLGLTLNDRKDKAKDKVKDAEAAKRKPAPGPAPGEAEAEDDAFGAGYGDGEGDVADDVGGQGQPAPGGSTLSLSVDRIVRPGMVVSGSVTFSDGQVARWGLDQYGRLALDASDAAYRPSAVDVQAFQRELRRVLERQGYGA